MAKHLDTISITRNIDGFMLEIEDDAGGTIKLLADEDQLAELTDEIERALAEEVPEVALHEGDDAEEE
ncbi:MAG: hypothetical protein H0X36_02325 [Sphingomonadaceae bacterium]|nr:hypothetical protein [Sphingomonadaceae bacterium]